MKKLTAAIISFALLMSSSAVQCAEDIKVLLDGKALVFDVPPQIISDRTMVPLRAIFEAMGAEVSWSDATKTVTAIKDNTTVEMTIDNNAIRVNNQEVMLDVAPMIIEGRTLVPARAVAQSFGASVDWNGEARTVTITSPVSKFPIEYNGALENKTPYLSNFKLERVEKNAEGKYDIDYTLKTFYEGKGTVYVVFNCLNAEGKIVDTFDGGFIGTDYAWSPQEGSATISGDTVLIEVKLD